jgi:ubiquinone/menaquinone biosynthesis C-methylase UbiE
LARHVTVVDVSPEMLAGISHPNVTPVVSDARDLSAFGDASFDVAVLMLVLHHITGRSPRETNAHLDRVLGAVFRTLRAGGRLVVVEPLMRPALAPLQRLGYPLLRLVLRLFGVPMVYFQTLSAMSLRLGRHWELVAATELVLDQPVDPLGGSFPGLVRLPPWLRHADYYLLQAVKG